MVFRVKKLTVDAEIPTRGTSGSVGYDLYSSVAMTIDPGDHGLVGTGISICPPDGTYGRIAPRSGLAVKKGIHVGAGVVDPDYTGELKVVIFNHGKSVFDVQVGDRIAQLVLECCVVPPVQVVGDDEEMTTTTRGDGGFGSTNVHF